MGVPVPLALEQWVQHLIQKDPRDRYQTAEAALEDLRRISEALGAGVADPAVVVGTRDQRRTLTEPAFIGRARELETLAGALERVSGGKGELVFVEGESGTGKTKLLDELARRGLQRRAHVFRGQGVDRSAQLPFQVLTGVFEGVLALGRERPGFAEGLCARLGEDCWAICEAVPQLLPVLGCEGNRINGPEALGESRTVRAMAALLEGLGCPEAPVVVLLDDCQWADELTLKLLAGWHQRPNAALSRHVLVVVSFRTEEVGEHHPLRALEPETRLLLPPFGAEEIRLLAASMAGKLPDEALDAVVRLAQGSPFMATAVMWGLAENGALVPGPAGWEVESALLAEVRSSRQATHLLVRHLARLSPAARRLLAAGAVLGRGFELELATTLAGQSPGEAAAALDEARRLHLLWAEEREGRQTLVHDRLREALLDMLSAEQCRSLHRLAATELERRAPGRTFEISYHFDAAGESERALPYALKAAEQARGQHALELAEHHYRMAERGAARADAATCLRVAEGLGDTLLLRRRYDEAAHRFTRALGLATTGRDRARIEGKRAELALMRWDLDAAVQASERALRLLGRTVPRGKTLLRLSTVWEVVRHGLHVVLPRGWIVRGRPATAEVDLLAVSLYYRLGFAHWLHSERMHLAVGWAHLRELNEAETYPPTPELALAYAAHATAWAMTPLPLRLLPLALALGKHSARKSLAINAALGNPWSLGRSLTNDVMMLYHSLALPECVEVCRRAIALLERTGDDWMALNMHWCLAWALYQQGELAAACEESQRSLRASVKLGDVRMACAHLEIQVLSSRGAAPLEEVERSPRPAQDDPIIATRLLSVKGLRLLREERWEEAAEALERALAIEQGAKLKRRYTLAWLATALREQAARVPPLAPARREALLRRASRTVRRALAMRAPPSDGLAHALREKGLVAAALGLGRRARRALDRSLAFAERHGLRDERARTLQARAEVGAAQGWPGARPDRAAAPRAPAPRPPAPAASGEALSLSLVDRFPRLLEAGRRIASALTHDAIFTAVREVLLGLLRGEDCAVMDISEALGEQVPAPFRTAILKALGAGGPVVLSEGMPGGEDEELAAAGIRSLLCAPILARGQPVACFCVTHRQLAGLFGEPEAHIAQFVAALAGAALENARGFAEVEALSEERRRLYQEAREALRKRDEFLAVASHELRTPLTPLKLQLQSLLRSARAAPGELAPERWTAKLEAAEARVQRFSKLVGQLSDFSKLSQATLVLHPEEVDFSALAAEVVERQREELARLECTCAVSTPGPVVGRWDSEPAHGGAGAPAVQRDEVWPAGAHRGDGGARRPVRPAAGADHGIGIAAKDQGRIFGRFERAVSVEHYGGFGLGL